MNLPVFSTTASTSVSRKPVRIELGSGLCGEPGFIHVDVLRGGNVDVRADCRFLTWLKPNSVDHLYAAHLVEHFSYTEIMEILRSWFEVLKPGGKLQVKLPDLDFLCRAYVDGIHSPEEVMIALYGGFADYPGGPDGWEKISGNPNWQRNTIKTGEIPHPGVYNHWAAHKAMYNYEMLAARLAKVGFERIVRIKENDWELHIVAAKN